MKSENLSLTNYYVALVVEGISLEQGVFPTHILSKLFILRKPPRKRVQLRRTLRPAFFAAAKQT